MSILAKSFLAKQMIFYDKKSKIIYTATLYCGKFKGTDYWYFEIFDLFEID